MIKGNTIKEEVIESEKNIELWNKPIVRSLIEGVSLLPGISPVVTLVEKTIENKIIQQNRIKQEMVIGYLIEENSITMEDIDDLDFVIDFAKLLEAVNKTRGNTKIKYLVKLFQSTICIEKKEWDIYDECLHELTIMSDREIRVLVELYKIYTYYDGDYKNRGKVFYEQLENVYGMSEKITNSLLSKLRKTGFCIENQGHFATGTGLEYYITEYGKSFISKILQE